MMVTLPWPPKELSPNTRTHWAKLAKAKKAYRATCFWLAKEAKLQAPPSGAVRVELTFYPPCRRARDKDNLIAMMKAGLDGLADAMQVNDTRFDPVINIADEIGGMVRVRVHAG